MALYSTSTSVTPFSSINSLMLDLKYLKSTIYVVSKWLAASVANAFA